MRRRWQSRKIDPRELRPARWQARLSVEEVAELLHVHRQTVLKWERGQHRIPYPAYKLLRVLRRYELPEACWDGWEARDGALWSPAGHRFTPGELAWLSLTFRRAEQFTVVRRELEALRASSVVISQGPTCPERLGAEGGRRPASGGGESQRVQAPSPLVDQCPLLDRSLLQTGVAASTESETGERGELKHNERSEAGLQTPATRARMESFGGTERMNVSEAERIATLSGVTVDRCVEADGGSDGNRLMAYPLYALLPGVVGAPGRIEAEVVRKIE